MSFGFSIGDFIAVLELASKVRKRWSDAPGEFAAVRDNTKRVHRILEDLDDLSQRVDVSTTQKAILTTIVADCKIVLAAANKVADAYSTNSDNRVRRHWSRLTANLGDLKRIQEQLLSIISQLNTVQNSIQIQITSETLVSVHELKSDFDNKTEREIINWFSPPAFAEQQAAQLQLREPGTANWFLQHPTYLAWREGSDQTLFCHGIQGSGKSVTFATVINDIQSHFENDADVKVIYFYCNYKRQGEQEFTKILRSLVRQLFQDKLTFPECVRKSYNQHLRCGSQPSEDELCSLIETLTETYSKVLLLVDALDECRNNDIPGTRDKLLLHLTKLQKKTIASVNIMTTCRPGIVNDFDSDPQIEIKAQPEDIARYLNANVASVVTCVANHPNEQKKIVDGIAGIVDGMFLLARLHLESLKNKTSIKAVRRAMESLPRGSTSAALDKAYEEVLIRINEQPDELKELAQKTLAWMTHARRELNIDELREALAIEPGITDIDPEIDLDHEQLITSACAGLVTIDEGSGAVRFAHYTVQVYLEHNQKRWLPDGKVDVATSCINYLLMQTFYDNGIDWKMDLWDLCRRYKLLHYVGKNWGFHAHELDDLNTYISSILCNNDSLRFASQLALGWHDASRSIYVCHTEDIPPINVCAYFDDQKAMHYLLGSGHDVNACDSDQKTALHIASHHNRPKIVAQLLEQQNININQRNSNEFTPLHEAANQGHTEIVDQLLARPEIEVNAGDKSKVAPLSYAACRGYTDVVARFLARQDVDVNTQDRRGDTPLAMAASFGRPEVVAQLLKRPDIDVNLGDESGFTPLSQAEFYGQTKIMDLLLARPEIGPLIPIRFQE